MWLSERKQKSQKNTRNSSWLLVGLATCMLFSALASLRPAIVSAQSSNVTVSLRDDLPPALSITSPVAGAAVSSSSVFIEGTVARVSLLGMGAHNGFREGMRDSTPNPLVSLARCNWLGTDCRHLWLASAAEN